MKTIHLLSGGLDSTVMLYDLLNNRWDVRCIGFHYGQTHFRELDAAKKIAHNLGLSYEIVNLPVLKGSSLTDGEGSFVVPNRNMIFLSIAAAMAAGEGREAVTYGCTAEDRTGFPDCRPSFVLAMNEALRTAGVNVRIETPYINRTKADIVYIGRRLKVPLVATWTCYGSGPEPCGECPSCKIRNAAMSAV